MKKSLVCSSLTGNTSMLADVIKEEVKDLIYFGDVNDCALDADLVYIGFWTNEGTCDLKTKKFISKLTKQKVFLFGTCGFGSDNYFQQIIKNVTSILPEGVEVIGSFVCQGKMKESVRERYVNLQKEYPDNSKFQMLIDNFDEALKHPNNDDLENLRKKLK